MQCGNEFTPEKDLFREFAPGRDPRDVVLGGRPQRLPSAEHAQLFMGIT